MAASFISLQALLRLRVLQVLPKRYVKTVFYRMARSGTVIEIGYVKQAITPKFTTMKKFLAFISGFLFAFAAFSQIYPNNAQTVTNLQQPSPQMVKTTYLSNLNGKLMQAYPNPARDEVVIQHVASDNRAVLYVINSDGSILQQQTVMPNALQTTLHIGKLNRGIYIVRFDNTRGDIRTLKLVKD